MEKHSIQTKLKTYKPLKTSGLLKCNLRQPVTLLLIRFLKNRRTISLYEQRCLLLLSWEGLWDMRYI